MEQILKSLLQEIKKCYGLGEQKLLERERLESVELKIRDDLSDVVSNLDDEILSLKFKKLNGSVRGMLKPGFHNIDTAKSDLEKWENLINEILGYIKVSTKTFKKRLETEGLFIESRSKEEGDIHLLIGQKDGKPDKAHVVIDEITGDIRIEENQTEPLDLVKKLESTITLKNGKKIKITREAIEEISE